jgi:hypothetical protein
MPELGEDRLRVRLHRWTLSRLYTLFPKELL